MGELLVYRAELKESDRIMSLHTVFQHEQSSADARSNFICKT